MGKSGGGRGRVGQALGAAGPSRLEARGARLAVAALAVKAGQSLGRAHEFRQTIENPRPFQTFERLLRDAKAHLHILDRVRSFSFASGRKVCGGLPLSGAEKPTEAVTQAPRERNEGHCGDNLPPKPPKDKGVGRCA